MEEKDIHPDDLIYLEEDLTKDELVSIMFLLYGSEKAAWILEKLRHREKDFSLLQDYATHHTHWKSAVVEALTATNLFEILNNLGISGAEARESSNKSVLNPGIKFLYQLCELCTKDITSKLIKFITLKCEPAKKCDEQMLEFFLLYCISHKLIKLSGILEDCDFTLIINFSKIAKNLEIERHLKKIPMRLNSTDNANNNSFTTTSLTLPSNSKNPVHSEYPAKKMHVLIINQQKFVRETNAEVVNMLPDHDLNDRKGTFKDMEALKEMFETFKYQVTVKNDLNHLELLKEVDKATKRASTGDGIIVCVLSHGHEGIVYGSNSIPVRIRDIRTIMASKVLLGKSKILLIQACQGENLQKSAKKIIPQLELDGPSQSTITTGSIYADFLIFWSTIEGFASVRHIDNGSWFIQELVRKVRELHKNFHLMDICTAVIKDVSSKRGYKDECMLPKLETTFTRNFRFPNV
jgi:hypothetical protein